MYNPPGQSPEKTRPESDREERHQPPRLIISATLAGSVTPFLAGIKLFPNVSGLPRFTDTLTVFIFILVGVYRTPLKFPHRLTLPAFMPIRWHPVRAANLFLWEVAESPMYAGNCLKRCASLHRLLDVNAINRAPLGFSFPLTRLRLDKFGAVFVLRRHRPTWYTGKDLFLWTLPGFLRRFKKLLISFCWLLADYFAPGRYFSALMGSSDKLAA